MILNSSMNHLKIKHHICLSSYFPERNCIWAPNSQVDLTNLVLSVTAQWAVDLLLLNQSDWRTLVKKNFSMEMWRYMIQKWWGVLRSCSWTHLKPEESASSGSFPDLLPSTFALRTSALQPSASSQEFRRHLARYTSIAPIYNTTWTLQEVCLEFDKRTDILTLPFTPPVIFVFWMQMKNQTKNLGAVHGKSTLSSCSGHTWSFSSVTKVGQWKICKAYFAALCFHAVKLPVSCP